MCVTNRWQHHLSNYSQLMHSVLGVALLVLGVAGVAVRVAREGELELEGVHSLPGGVITLGSILISVGGAFALYYKKYAKWRTGTIKTLRFAHRVGGATLLIASTIVTFTGLLDFTEDQPLKQYSWIAYFELIFWLVLYLAGELYFRKVRGGEDPFPDLSKYPVLSEAAFKAKVEHGEKLVILDNVILNLAAYEHQHPGGAFLLQQTVGRDISKYFYGGYALDGNMNLEPGQATLNHAHTNIARKVAYKHIVGVIENA